ncbi:transporter [Aquimarina brevivitae]|uniref:Outer membrane putative beta-barrel porin/alpha-amylase n=1 Tax=Aquimarina brevivitae TaxID=323412 RepID=A0A4Q7PIL8_9FLAO|nr:transporter [Aquimarina brevivitae]RZT00286.1 outer membrane putative beta-barrel porin/alpha-amylase [Aquimarina brevivitae]
MKINSISLLTFFSLLIGGSIIAQETTPPPLVTDRPDATESPTVVPIGTVQIETGAFYEESEDLNVVLKNTTFNTTLMRIGLLERLELRIGWDFSEIKTEIDGTELNTVQNGLSPLLFGAKVNITEEKGLLPEIGLIGHIFLPFTASQDFRPETTGTNFRFSFAHTLSEKSSLSYNIGAVWGDDSPEAAYIYTLAYGYSVTNKFGLYAELYGDFPEDSQANHLWDAGLTYLVTDLIQLDATVGSGIQSDQNLLLSAGVSIRLPK